MSKIGIMGGTFNPIHYGHLLLAENAYEQLQLDTVWIMPNKNPAYRKISSNISVEHRSNMIQLAIEDNPHLTFSDVELRREGATYTVDTLELLKKEDAGRELYFIMGSDSIFQLESWKNPARILKLCHIVVAQRGERAGADLESQMDYLGEKYDAEIHLLNCPNLDISSHGIRKRVRLGRSFKYLLPRKVEDYIMEQQLYIES